jgi:formylglycine-generating enzyme required for sulfatase activity
MPDFHAKKREALTKQHDNLIEEWTALIEELNRSLDPSARIRLQRQIDDLESRIIALEQQLTALEALKPSATPVASEADITTSAQRLAVFPPKARVPAVVSSIVPTLPDGAELISIPAGEFIMGSSQEEIAALLNSKPSYKREWFEGEIPKRRVILDAYFIYKTPVTVSQYLMFCTATGHRKPKGLGFNQRWQPSNQPIINVSWEDAQAYCAWVSHESGRNVTLPTEAQWEKAARGTDGQIYPWGNEWNTDKCAHSVGSYKPDGTMSVDSYPTGMSPFGVLDMVGNAWEWCLDWYDESYYEHSPLHNPPGPLSSPKGYRVLRGGSWAAGDLYVFRCAFRFGYSPGTWFANGGIRCVVALPRP